MTVKLDTDLITIISFSIGIVGLIFATYQTISSKRAKKVYENHCKSKCKNIVSLTRTISEEVIHACSAIHEEIDSSTSNEKRSHSNLTYIAERINGINVSTKRLVDFCIEINDEHESQFGYKIYPDINDELPDIECLRVAKNTLTKTIKQAIND